MKTILTPFFALIVTVNCYSQECDSLHSPCLGTFSRNGFYFDLEAASDITLSGISYLVQNVGTRDVSLYYRQGTYFGFEGVASNWTLLGTDSAVTPDNGLSCPIPHQPAIIDFTICIPQGQRYGFYLVMSSGTGTLESHSNLAEGSIAAQDSYLKLITGKGQQGIGDFSGTLTPSLSFQGAFQYDCLCVTSVNEKQSAAEISLYPNPAGNKFAINSGQLAINKIEVYDGLGQCLIQHQTSPVDVSILAPGIYFVKVFTDEKIHTMKLVKQ
jgi:hypothetical protein